MFQVTADRILRNPANLQGAYVQVPSGLVKVVAEVLVRPAYAELVFTDEDTMRVSRTGNDRDGAEAAPVVSY